MTLSLRKFRSAPPRLRLRRASARSLAIVFALAIVATATAQAQTFTVIHNFTGGADGAYPVTGLTMDAFGNLYGTTYMGGIVNDNCPQVSSPALKRDLSPAGVPPGSGCGIVFKLQNFASGWVLTPIHSFTGGSDGGYPAGRVSIAADGTLYGTSNGADNCNVDESYGTVFHLTPPPSVTRTALAPWNEAVIHTFAGSDGACPGGDLTFDQSGNIYGTAALGGANGTGAIYQLTRAGGGWTETVLYSPPGGQSGWGNPSGGVVFDSSGNLYGVFENTWPNFDGAIYELSPSKTGWLLQNLTVLDVAGYLGGLPVGGLIMDAHDNFYGTTADNYNGGGNVFEGNYITENFYNLYLFPGYGGFTGPKDKLFMDSTGNLYGTTNGDGLYQNGSAFMLGRSGGGWSYTSLHDFTGGSDGGYPVSNLVPDTNGNLYGTASAGGAYGYGVVFEITP